jgi:hypothetical protein
MLIEGVTSEEVDEQGVGSKHCSSTSSDVFGCPKLVIDKKAFTNRLVLLV